MHMPHTTLHIQHKSQYEVQTNSPTLRDKSYMLEAPREMLSPEHWGLGMSEKC